MEYQKLLSDFDHPAVVAKAKELTDHLEGNREKIEAIFLFVRDAIKFGFPPKWDIVKASEVLDYGCGYCNTKATLFLALCKAADITARIHCGLIDVEIMRGIYPSRLFSSLPSAGPHSWIDLHVNGTWKSIDSYINDERFYECALKLLRESGNDTGYSISVSKGESSCELNFGEKGYVHMGAVIDDHGVWEDYSEYVSSERYVSMSEEQLKNYPLIAKLANRAIERIRSK
jgi:hypothetical protein